MSSKNFKCNKNNSKNSVGSLRKKIVYDPLMFGFSGIKGDGNGVKICVIDTGYPQHSTISFSSSHVVDFSNSPSGAKDIHGHSTGVAGLLKSKGSHLVGIVPKAEIYYAKGLSDDGEGSCGAVQASILYSIIKQVDIIVMSFGSEMKHPMLHDAIKKAFHSGIALFAASGQDGRTTKDSDYPARFPEVMSVGYKSANYSLSGVSDAPHLSLSIKNLQTTFINNKYIKMNGTSSITPIVAGVGAILLQQSKMREERLNPKDLYNKLMLLSDNKKGN